MPKKKNVAVLDTNLIVRFLVGDVPEQTLIVKKLFQEASPKTFYVPDAVIAEVLYVLTVHYNYSRTVIAEKLTAFLNLKILIVNQEILQESLRTYKQTKLSFIDAYVHATTKMGEYSLLYTFDKELQKLDKKRIMAPSS